VSGGEAGELKAAAADLALSCAALAELPMPATRDRLRDAYLAEWASFASREQLLRAWRLAEPLAALNQAISYVSIVSNLEPGADHDGLSEETGVWLRRLIDWYRQPSP
jgi:hypothetical protein